MISINAISMKWAYRKLKNYIYYASPASYLKDKIMQFEDNYNDNSFEDMANELQRLFSSKHDMVKGKGISYIVFPKKDGVDSDNEKIIVNDYNVFLDMPLKFYLVDVLFTLDIFTTLNYKASDYSFGNDFDKRLWKIKENELDGNILENNLLFANFNAQYDLWKEKIYNAIEETSEQDKIIIKMDFKRSYYNAYFDIDSFIKELFNDDSNDPICEFEKQLYYYYSGILNRIIDWSTPKTHYVHLPVGLFSSACIYNILLKEFDEIVKGKSLAYSRYVDDILIVLPKTKKSNLNDILEEFFSGLFITVDNDLVVNSILDKKGSFIINKKKIKILSYKSGYPLRKLQSRLNKIIKPSMDVIEEMDFDDDNLDESFLFKHDYIKKIVQMINSDTDEKCEFIKKLSDSEYINIFRCWKMLLSNVENKDYFEERIEQAIKRTSLSNGDAEFDEKLRTALYLELDYASNNIKYKNHLLCDIEQDCTLEYIAKMEQNYDNLFYPLTITFDEITLYLSQKQDFICDDFINEAEILYKRINRFSLQRSFDISINKNLTNSIYYVSKMGSAIDDRRMVRVAVANINLSFDDLERTGVIGSFPPTYDIYEFKHLIDLAKNSEAEIIIFPEFSLPEKYAFDIIKHCRKRKISIVTGLTHRNIGGELVNLVLIRDNDLDLALYKWKNYMPIDEKKYCLEHNYGYRVPQIPYYFIIDNGRYKYSTMTCFEATSITDRALLCDEIEILYMPVFNRDTYYFSNIISSFVRDASCFVAQSNSNQYGDSRISGPYGRVFLDVVKLKGGMNNYFVIGEVDLDSLRVKNNVGEDFESSLDLVAISLPSWDNTFEDKYKEYKEKGIKPISAGLNRYTIRKNNGLD